MPRELLLPELAESVVEGEILQWLVNEGDLVTENQSVVEVMTDKATVELPSPFSGVLEKKLVKEGDIVAIETAIALFSDDDSAQDETVLIEVGEKEKTAALFKSELANDSEAHVVVSKKQKSKKTGSKNKGPFGRVLAVPAARKLARDKGLDIEQIPGSGPNGRVRVDDVKAFDAKPAKESQALEERIPLRGLRRVIAKQMTTSHLEAVRTLHVDEADVSALVTLRKKLKPIAAEQGVKLSYLPFIMKALVSALKKFPIINSSLDQENNEIILKKYYNFGLAVATENGLVVPIVKNVDALNGLELAQKINDLAEKTRENRLELEELQGGTFTVTNIGSLGGLFSFPIINLPEAAILGVHSIKKRAVVLEDDSIVARSMIYLSLSFDHRLIDGAEAAMFMTYLIKLLETPERLFLEF